MRGSRLIYIGFLLLPYVNITAIPDDNPGKSVNIYPRKVNLVGFSPKGRHNFNIVFDMGIGFSYTTYNSVLNAKVYTISGQVLTYDRANGYYSLPTPLERAIIYEKGPLLIKDGLGYVRNMSQDPKLAIDINNNLNFTYYGIVIPVRVTANYCLFRRVRLGATYDFMMNLYYFACADDLCSKLSDKKNLFIAKEPLQRSVNKWLLKERHISWNQKALGVLGVKLFEFGLRSIWLSHGSGVAIQMGAKPFGNYAYMGYTGNVNLNIEKYLSELFILFYGVSVDFSFMKDKNPYGQRVKTEAMEFKQVIPFRFSMGIIFSTNDGYYKDYKDQEADDNYYLNKYNRTFEYYSEI